MAGIRQNKQTPYFHCGPQKNLNNKKSKKGVSKSLKTVKQLVNKSNITNKQY